MNKSCKNSPGHKPTQENRLFFCFLDILAKVVIALPETLFFPEKRRQILLWKHNGWFLECLPKFSRSRFLSRRSLGSEHWGMLKGRSSATKKSVSAKMFDVIFPSRVNLGPKL